MLFLSHKRVLVVVTVTYSVLLLDISGKNPHKILNIYNILQNLVHKGIYI